MSLDSCFNPMSELSGDGLSVHPHCVIPTLVEEKNSVAVVSFSRFTGLNHTLKWLQRYLKKERKHVVTIESIDAAICSLPLILFVEEDGQVDALALLSLASRQEKGFLTLVCVHQTYAHGSLIEEHLKKYGIPLLRYETCEDLTSKVLDNV